MRSNVNDVKEIICVKHFNGGDVQSCHVFNLTL